MAGGAPEQHVDSPEPAVGMPAIRAMAVGIYLPSLLYGIGQGAIAPVIVLTALHLGASSAEAGFIAGLVGLGQLLGDIPAGLLAARFGERRALQLAIGLALVALTVCVTAPGLWVFALAVGAVGFSAAVWGLARHLYITEVVPRQQRARALSTLGGVQRVGMFLGPFAGAGVLSLVGETGPYWVHIAAALAAWSALLATRRVLPDHHSAGSDASLGGLVRVVRENARPLGTLGLAAFLVGAVRASRQVVIPLWGSHIGLDPSVTVLIFGLSGAIDMVLFYPAGAAMDRFGRRGVAAVSMATLGTAFLLLPLTQDVLTMALVAVLMGIGNGAGSGIIMTISSDASPARARGQFLAAFRLISDGGMMAGPFAVGAVTAAVALGPAVAVIGAVGWLSSGALARWVPARRAR